MTHPLDRCVWHALSERQAALAQGNTDARRYDPDYAPFAGTRDDSPASLAALHDIVPPRGAVALFTADPLECPTTLAPLRRATVVQMTLQRAAAVARDRDLPPTARPLSAADAPAMMALAELTKPGPFPRRAPELGRFLGFFADDRLIAMAGERMCLDGFVEISAVCTHPDHRGHGLAAVLSRALARAAFARGELPFLHVFSDNATAIGVYRRLGFSTRAELHLTVVGRAQDRA